MGEREEDVERGRSKFDGGRAEEGGTSRRGCRGQLVGHWEQSARL